jgi:molybdenum cofactor biosynthesis enzyme
MCKALSHDIRIASVRLLSKSGGKRVVRAGARTRMRMAA